MKERNKRKLKKKFFDIRNNFLGHLVLTLHCYCGYNISFKVLVSKIATTWRLKKPQSNDKLLYKICLPDISWNKKDSSKKAVSFLED